MIRLLPLFAAGAISGWFQPASGASILETRPWPKQGSCMNCVTLQFGDLEMQMPGAVLGRVFVFAGGPPGMHFLPREGTKPWMLLAAKSRKEVIGIYPGIRHDLTGQQFFDMLGSSDRYVPAYKAEGVERAIRYTKASDGKLHAYWIEAEPGQAQFVQIVIDGNDTIYTLMGDYSSSWVDAVLAHLRVAPIP